MILQFAILIGQTTGLFLFFKLEHNNEAKPSAVFPLGFR